LFWQACSVAIAAIYPLYFTSANAPRGRRPHGGEIAAELDRWRTWHWVRTGAGVLGFWPRCAGLPPRRS
jgi:hypothetical protein